MTTNNAKALNVRDLLGGKKYTIDYFQSTPTLRRVPSM